MTDEHGGPSVAEEIRASNVRALALRFMQHVVDVAAPTLPEAVAAFLRPLSGGESVPPDVRAELLRWASACTCAEAECLEDTVQALTNVRNALGAIDMLIGVTHMATHMDDDVE